MEEKDQILQRVDSLERGHSNLSTQITKLTDNVGTLTDRLDTHQKATDRHLDQQDFTTNALKEAVSTTGGEVKSISKILVGDIIDGKPGLHQTVVDIKRIVEAQTVASDTETSVRRKAAVDVKVGTIIALVGAIFGIGASIIGGCILFYFHMRS